MNLCKCYGCATTEKEFLKYVKRMDNHNIEYVPLSPRAFGNYLEEHFIFSRALAKFLELVKL